MRMQVILDSTFARPGSAPIWDGKKESSGTGLALSKTQILMGHIYHSLSIDATIMVSKNCPITGEHVGFIFVTQ